jgi:F-type H+-transporting ATPase subunit a
MINFYTEICSPLDQFEIRNLLSVNAPILGNIQLSITNIGLYLVTGTFLILSLNFLATNNNKIISNE